MAQLDETVGEDSRRFTATVLAQFPTGGGEESDTGTEAQVEVCSAFALPAGLYARFYRYGFVPTEQLRYRVGMTTKEFGLNGMYIRRYFNLRCMVSGEHILEYDGVEHGIFRLNSDFSAGREVIDTIPNMHQATRWGFRTAP